jgi:hypothetical protein
MIWLGLAAVLAGAALTGWLAYRFGGQLETVFAETERLDPYWRLDDLEEHRPTVPDAGNGGLKVSALRVQFPALFLPFQPQEAIGEFTSEHQLNVVQIEALDVLLQAAGPDRLAEARALIAFPRGRHAVTYSPDWFGTMLPHLQNHREVLSLLRYDALARSQVGDAGGAIEDAHAALNVGSSIGDEPILVSQVIRVACQTLAVYVIERALAQGEPPPERLAVLQRRLEELDGEPLALYGLRGERAGFDRVVQNLEGGGVAGSRTMLPSVIGNWKLLRGITGVRSAGPPDYEALTLFIPGNLARQRAEGLRHFNRAIEIVKRPPEQWRPDLDAWNARTKQLSYLPRLVLPALAKLTEVAQRNHAQLRCAATAVAAERYRRQTDRWPATTDELVKARLLMATPIDPYDGQPLRLKRLADGLVIYAVGSDLADNGGNLDRSAIKPGTDLGFRLWDVPARRQPPLPPKPEDGAGP